MGGVSGMQPGPPAHHVRTQICLQLLVRAGQATEAAGALEDLLAQVGDRLPPEAQSALMSLHEQHRDLVGKLGGAIYILNETMPAPWSQVSDA